MNKPTLDDLMKNVNSKYTLVVMAAKRARTFTANQIGKEDKGLKPVSKALFEIADGRIKYEQIYSGIK